MEVHASVNQPAKHGPQSYQMRNGTKKQPQHSADIVYSKGASIQTMPSLSKLLKGNTECVIGLQFVWEYRSPSKSVPPHYQCKLCAVSRLQHDMVAHIKGWKHSFRYLKHVYPDKVRYEEEEAIKDPAVRKAIKEISISVQEAEGSGTLKVILKEPCEVLAFKGLRTAIPKCMPPTAPGMGPKRPPFGPRFSDPRFPGEFAPQGCLFPDYPVGDYEEPDFSGFDYPARQDSLGSGMDRRPFPDALGHRPPGHGDGFGPGGGRDGYGRSGLLEDNPGRMHTEYRTSLLDRPIDKSLERPGLMGAAPESSNRSNTLLTYLDTFRIENENDAQMVLKVTQKLTDVLMEYRLRSVSRGPSANNFLMSSTNFTPTPRLLSSRDRFPSTSLLGQPRHSDGPPRYYK
ncbi:uncharacterized protein si:ch211-197h24.6 isoform X1 [Pseudoliparis swirei]|uniref:uncharacterized protein si:ch211-197h24.6 isoform X1 n=2 Tax=Pseudoliparis swirei TaxID=2059687 RepID=UPI0024BF07C8|nr:uncharacterized protein si:ch211-197h24.6 isoform X1 [Pseudoliparis swirei]